MYWRGGKVSWKRRGVLSRVLGKPLGLSEGSVHPRVPGGGVPGALRQEPVNVVLVLSATVSV